MLPHADLPKDAVDLLSGYTAAGSCSDMSSVSSAYIPGVAEGVT